MVNDECAVVSEVEPGLTPDFSTRHSELVSESKFEYAVYSETTSE